MCVYDKNTDNILQNISTTCQADAKWENEDNFECKQPNYDVNIISVSEGDIWAVGYYGDFYTGTVSSTSFNRLGWELGDQIVEYLINQDGTCTKINDHTTDVRFSIICYKKLDEIVSNLSINTELRASDTIKFYSYEGENCGYKETFNNFQVNC